MHADLGPAGLVIQWQGRSLYIFILLEFQSKVDRFMAVRAMTYDGLLLEYLVQEKAFTPSGKLPPVFILVLYNGIGPWGAALDVADLIEPVPGGLEAYRPHLRYALLDEARFPDLPLTEVQRRKSRISMSSRSSASGSWPLTLWTISDSERSILVCRASAGSPRSSSPASAAGRGARRGPCLGWPVVWS
jgi:hypothetical protein